MSWRDGFSAQGSFRGATFWVRDAKLQAGRRVQVHEYPQRDEPYNEDLGRKARKMNFEAYCIGPDYHLERDKLIAEIEKAGPGALRHPYLGDKSVVVVDFSTRESTREGGFVAITIQCVEAGKQAFPSTKPSTQFKTKKAVEQTLNSAVLDFSREFILSDASTASEDFLADVRAVFSPISNTVGDVTSPLSDLLLSPLDLGTSIAGMVTGLNSSITAPLLRLDVFRKLFDAGDRPSVSNTSPRSLQTARNQHALNILVRSSAVLSAANATADMELSPAKQTGAPLTRDRVLSIRDEVLTEIDDIQETVNPVGGDPIDDGLFDSLASLRLAVTEDLSTRAGRLPAVRNHTPEASLPALVLAHNLYGDASREAEIVSLNNIPHPGRVVGGRSLEVLSE